jgi:hypothetical protein
VLFSESLDVPPPQPANRPPIKPSTRVLAPFILIFLSSFRFGYLRNRRRGIKTGQIQRRDILRRVTNNARRKNTPNPTSPCLLAPRFSLPSQADFLSASIKECDRQNGASSGFNNE